MLFNYSVFLRWMLSGFIHGTLAFFIPWLALASPSPDRSGQGYGVWCDGLFVYT